MDLAPKIGTVVDVAQKVLYFYRTLLSPNLALSQLSIRKTMASTAGK
jgi:hypothetical protein